MFRKLKIILYDVMEKLYFNWRTFIQRSTHSRICDLDHKMEGIEQIRLRAKRSLLYIDKKIHLKS